MVKAKLGKREKMLKLGVRAKDNESYASSLNASGARFSGSASAIGDAVLIAEARLMSEPDWTKLKLEDLLAAEKMTKHKLSGGEASWQPVLQRIKAVLKKAR